MAPDIDALLRAYDSQLRGRVPERLPATETLELDGPLLRFRGGAGGGWVLYRDLGGLEGRPLDELIARQVAVFAEHGERFEWKTHGHDRPADLIERLLAAGFRPEDQETILIATTADIADRPVLPDGVSLREVTQRADLDRIEAMEAAVWETHNATHAAMLEAEVASDPDGITIVVAEAEDTVVCAAWVRFDHGTEFATLWGGATLPGWRRRGIYRATVAYRAGLAAARGFRFLQVDASDDSRPILERLGFVAVTTTTPYVWTPSGA